MKLQLLEKRRYRPARRLYASLSRSTKHLRQAGHLLRQYYHHQSSSLQRRALKRQRSPTIGAAAQGKETWPATCSGRQGTARCRTYIRLIASIGSWPINKCQARATTEPATIADTTHTFPPESSSPMKPMEAATVVQAIPRKPSFLHASVLVPRQHEQPQPLGGGLRRQPIQLHERLNQLA